MTRRERFISECNASKKNECWPRLLSLSLPAAYMRASMAKRALMKFPVRALAFVQFALGSKRFGSQIELENKCKNKDPLEADGEFECDGTHKHPRRHTPDEMHARESKNYYLPERDRVFARRASRVLDQSAGNQVTNTPGVPANKCNYWRGPRKSNTPIWNLVFTHFHGGRNGI